MARIDLNQFMEDINEQLLECTICLNRVQLPTSLSCHHSFCLQCLKEWVGKNKGVLTCPTCSRSEPIPEGGLENLQPNTFLNNLLEMTKRFENRNQTKCVCGGQEKYYCQECRHNLCSLCSDHHKLLPTLSNHKLHTLEDVQSMTPQQFALLNPPMCSLHNKKLEFYCVECKVPTCMNCIITEHRVWEGKPTSISISDAFKKFKETSAELEATSLQYKTKLQDGLDAVIENDKRLDQNRDDSLRDIEHHMQEMINLITENGEKLKTSINEIYKEKREVNEKQIKELKLNISDVNTNLSFLHQLLKSDEATAMQSSENVTKALKDKIEELPKTEPEDNGELYFIKNKHQFDSLQQSDIGNITQIPAEYLILTGPEVVTERQTTDVKIVKTDQIKIDVNQLDATWMQPTGEANVIEIKEDDIGDGIVKLPSTCPGISTLNVSVGGTQIKGSPMIIRVENEGLINTINVNLDDITGVVKSEDDCLLVSCLTNEIYKYKLSGEYINKIKLPKGVKVCMMYKMMNGNIVFSDRKSIKVCDMDGLVMKSIGEGILYSPRGIYVDDVFNVAYVADIGGTHTVDGKTEFDQTDTSQLVLFDLDSGQMLKKIKSQDIRYSNRLYNITVTSIGNLVVVDYLNNNKVLLFDSGANFLKVLITNGELKNPRGVVVDQDDNVIISCNESIKIFSMDGTFIKQINKDEDGIKDTYQLTIISYHPRQIAVANGSDRTIKIYNY